MTANTVYLVKKHFAYDAGGLLHDDLVAIYENKEEERDHVAAACSWVINWYNNRKQDKTNPWDPYFMYHPQVVDINFYIEPMYVYHDAKQFRLVNSR